MWDLFKVPSFCQALKAENNGGAIAAPCPFCTDHPRTVRPVPNSSMKVAWNTSGPRVVHHTAGVSWYLSRRVKCDTCGTKFQSDHEDFLPLLPPLIMSAFPVLMSSRSGYTIDLTDRILFSGANGGNFSSLEKEIAEAAAKRRSRLELIYTLHAKHAPLESQIPDFYGKFTCSAMLT